MLTQTHSHYTQNLTYVHIHSLSHTLTHTLSHSKTCSHADKHADSHSQISHTVGRTVYIHTWTLMFPSLRRTLHWPTLISQRLKITTTTSSLTWNQYVLSGNLFLVPLMWNLHPNTMSNTTHTEAGVMTHNMSYLNRGRIAGQEITDEFCQAKMLNNTLLKIVLLLTVPLTLQIHLHNYTTFTKQLNWDSPDFHAFVMISDLKEEFTRICSYPLCFWVLCLCGVWAWLAWFSTKTEVSKVQKHLNTYQKYIHILFFNNRNVKATTT